MNKKYMKIKMQFESKSPENTEIYISYMYENGIFVREFVEDYDIDDDGNIEFEIDSQLWPIGSQLEIFKPIGN